MNEIVSVFKGTLNYLKGLVEENKLNNIFDEKINEQFENLVDLEELIIEYEKDMLCFDSYEKMDSSETLHKLMLIHVFITTFEWHLSEISELKDEFLKYRVSKLK